VYYLYDLTVLAVVNDLVVVVVAVVDDLIVFVVVVVVVVVVFVGLFGDVGYKMRCMKQEALVEPNIQLVNDQYCISTVDLLKASYSQLVLLSSWLRCRYVDI